MREHPKSGLHSRHFQGAAHCASVALQAVGMQETLDVTPAFVRFELHRADSRAQFTLGGAFTTDYDAAIVDRQLAAPRRYPR